MNFKIHRNDPCPCDSGLKYKKCCIQSTLSGGFDISYFDDGCNELDFQDGREVVPDDITDVLVDLYFQLQVVTSFSSEQSAQFFEFLRKLREEYPKHPVIVNYLYNGHVLMGDEKIANLYMLEMHEKFPLYFFGRLIYASTFLRNKQYEQAFELLGKYDSLKALYPERTKFHVSEGYKFHEFAVELHAAMKNRILAKLHYDCLLRLSSTHPTSDSAQIVQAARERIEWIELSAMHAIFKNLQSLFAQENPQES